MGIGVSISLASSGAVQILSINPSGGAAATGQVFVGDIISKINGRSLRTIEEARSLIPGPPGSECSLLLKRTHSSGRNESIAVIVRRISAAAAGGPSVGPSQAVTPQSPAAPLRDRSVYNTDNSVTTATKSNKESPAHSQPPSRGEPLSTFGSSTSIAKSLDSASVSIGRSIDSSKADNRVVDAGSPRGSSRGSKVANSPLSAFSTFNGDPSKAAGVTTDKLAQDLRVITLDLKMKMENDRDAQLLMCSSTTMTELRGSDLRKKDETIELLKQRIDEVTKSSDDLRRQSAQMSSRYMESLQQVKALEAETLLLKQHVIEYQSQCEELAHGQRHALSKLTELDAENRLLKERLDNPESGRSSERSSRLETRADEATDRKFHNDLHAMLMASLVHTTPRPEADQLGNHPDIDPQKLILKALTMLQARIAINSSSADSISEAQSDGAREARVLSPPRGPNMHLQTRFTGTPASPSFAISRQALQTPSSVISTQVNSAKYNSGFV